MNVTLSTNPFKLILLFAFFLMSGISLHAQDLYINEFMASNASTIADENGEFDDWVEIYNAGTTPVNIAGMYLTDDTTNTTKWQIPATNPALTTIPANGFLLLWFDKEPEQGELHVDTKLGAGGEDVGLYAADGTTLIDAYTFGPQLEDISEGRVPDAGSDWDFYAEPTPGVSNNTSDSGVDLTEIPVADMSGGLYPGTITVELSSATPDAEIYYTLDGTDPTDNSIEYTGAITISDITPLRAIAYSPTLLPSKVMTETYLIDVEHDFAIVAINTDTVNLYDEDIGIFTNFEEDIEAPAHIQFYEPDGALAFSQDIEIEVFGNASAALPQKSLKLKAKAGLGNEFFEYEIFPDQDFDEYRSFIVRQSGQDWNITMFRDAFEQGLFDDIADLNGVLEKPDLDLQGYRPGVVYLNGEYWGIYNVREQMNWKYLNTHYGIEQDEVDIVEDDDELELGDLNEWISFNNFLENTNFSSDANYQTLRQKADVDHYIDYMLQGLILDNNDWPGNNNKHYREKKPDAKWRWLSKDLDFGFGLRPLNSTWNSGDFTTNMLEICLAENSSNYYNPPEATLFLRRLMQNDQSKTYFINRAADFLNTIFEPSRVVARIDSLETIYIPEVQAHFDRWQSGYNDHEEDVDILRIFANGRAPEVRTHFVNYYPEISGTTAVSIDANPSDGGNINFSTLNFTETNFPWDGSYFQGIDIPVSAKPARGFVLDSWSDVSLGNDLETIVNINSASYDLTANFIPGSSATDPIVINEINYNSPDFPNPEDWIELYNPNTTAVDISGWYFEDESGDYFGLPANTILAAGAYLILAEDLESFMNVYPNATNVIASFGQDPGGFGLSGGGELITIKNANGVLIDEVEYDDNSPWPEEPDGDGPSLQLIDPALDNSLASSWEDFDPTPGTLNGVAAIPQDQSIDFPEIDDQLTFSPPIQLEAVATSGLPITYSIISGPATVSGSTLLLDGTVGTVVVRASQAGNADYYAATDVDQNFYVEEFTGGPEGYCESEGNAPWQEWISNIAFNTIDNPSLKTQYSDFTNVGTFVTQNSNYDITLTPSFSGTVFEEYWRVWIDFNQDGDFEDAGEEVFSISSSNDNPLTGNITIPSDTELGATRMRVAMKRDAFADPCETFAKGEVEDYTVFIEESSDILTFDCPASINETISGSATELVVTWDTPTGSTSCASGIVEVVQTNGDPSGSAFPIGSTTIGYEATDDCGNIGSCSFTITVTVDNGSLSITCPDDINTTVPGGATGVLVTWTEPMPSSTCPLGGETASQTTGPMNGTLFPVGETIVTYAATDDCGNMETCSFIVTVTEDFGTLTINCPTDIDLTVSGSATAAIANWTEPIPSTTCTAGGETASQTGGPSNGTLFPLGATVVTYTATDDCGNEETCTFTVTVTLVNGDLSINCPANIDLTVSGNATGAIANWTEPIPTTSCPLGGEVATQTGGPVNGTLFPLGATVVTYTATDDCGNEETCSFTVTVTLVNGDLTIDCPADISLTVSGSATGAIANWTEPIPTTSCPLGGEVATQTGGPANGTLFPIGTTVVTYTATDDCGNEETCSFTVTVTLVNGDLTIDCPADISLTVSGSATGAIANWTEPIPTTSCPLGGEVATQTGGPANGTLFPLGATVVTYTATDDCGNEETCTFNVVVTLVNGDLSINCPTDIDLTVSGPVSGAVASWVEPIPTTSCPTGGETASQTGGPANGTLFPIGATVVTYTATDDCGNEETCSFIVTVILDNGELTITCPGDITEIIPAGSTGTVVTWVEPTPSTTCPLAGAIVSQTGGLPNGSVFPIGTTVINYEAMDDCGNIETCSFSVTVELDASELTIDCPDDVLVNTLPGAPTAIANWNDAIAMTSCPQGGLVSGQNSGAPSGSAFPIGTSEINYKAIDDCDNSVECTFNVIVEATPVDITIDCPANISVPADAGGAGATVNWTEPTGSTNCYLNGLLVTQTAGDPSGSFFPVGTHTVSYEAIDACLEVTTCSFEITVTNSSGTISLDCPDDINIVLPLGQSLANVNWSLPVASSSCNGGDPNPNCGTTISGFTSLGTQGDQEYFISQTNRPWTLAQADCELYGGYLVAIGSVAEDEFIGNNVSEIIHIGINDATVEGTLEWINGEAVNYTNFTSSSQNTASNDYSYKAPWNGKWKMYSGSAYKKYVMELDCGGGSPVDLNQTSGPTNGADLAAGVYTVVYEATDDCGDLQVCSFTITIEENPQSLVIECPDDITVTEESGTGGAVVTWPDATATSVNCPGAITITQTSGDPSGSVFPIGTQVISYTATDACANVETCSFTITVEADSPPTDYCEAAGTAPWAQHISNVSFNTINNNSGKDGYGDFTGISTNVDTDASYTISVTPKFSWTQWDEYIRVWIDYNGDLDFDDAGEKVFEAIYTAGQSGTDAPPLTGTVTVPTDAAAGMHRMRVAMKKEAFAEPCEIFTFGEVEDYTVEVNFNGSNLEGTSETFFFNAMKNGREVAMNWITDTEYKNDHFVIEHSLDGLSFETLTEIESREDVDAQRMYNEVDSRPALGVNYYRLKQVYKDGSFRHSGVKKIVFDIDLEGFSLFPNPAMDQVFINLKKYEGMEADIQIFNALGQQIVQNQIDEIPEHAIRIDVSKFQNGIYTISVKVEDRKRLTKQFVVSRLY